MFVGKLGRDGTGSGEQGPAGRCLFDNANRRFRQAEEQKEEVCYIDIVVFGKQAENCGQYLNKGDGAIIDGRLQQRRWETDDGQRRSKHEVVAQSVTFLPKKQGQGPEGEVPADPGYESEGYS